MELVLVGFGLVMSLYVLIFVWMLYPILRPPRFGTKRYKQYAALLKLKKKARKKGRSSEEDDYAYLWSPGGAIVDPVEQVLRREEDESDDMGLSVKGDA